MISDYRRVENGETAGRGVKNNQLLSLSVRKVHSTLLKSTFHSIEKYIPLY